MSVKEALLSPELPASATAKPGFEILGVGPAGKDALRHTDPYSAAVAYVKGLIIINGDLVEAVRDFLNKTEGGWRRRLLDAVCRWTPWRVTEFWYNPEATAREIRFHYDRSNEFFQQFLDKQLVYSCAYFQHPGESLDQAQAGKLEHICRKLRLTPGDRFLDIGCGWGALVRHAAREYGALAGGCTLSHRQAEYAQEQIRVRGLAGQAVVHEGDYRDVTGQYDKIASAGMFEHVGRRRLESYFRKVHGLLAPGGLFLNHGITRPSPVHNDAQSLFLARKVFPGGQIVRLEDVVHSAERAGFEIVDVENLRRHYALTCRDWVERLRANRDGCLQCVDEETWRTWQLYLAGSALAFEEGTVNLHQVLLARRGDANVTPMTREYMYRPAMAARRNPSQEDVV